MKLPRINMEQTATIAFFVLLIMVTAQPATDPDTFWHIRAGERIISEQAVPLDDVFSHTFDGQQRIPHDWLGQVVFYGIYSAFGSWGLSILTTVLAIGGTFFLWKASEGRPYLRVFIFVLCIGTMRVFWTARPQMFSFFLSTVVLWIVFRYKRHNEDRLWLLPPLFLLWVNLHGGWSIGAIILLLTAAGEILNHLLRSPSPHVIPIPRLVRFIVFSALAAVALVINPVGFDMLLVPLDTFQLGALREFIEEWRPPELLQHYFYPFILLLILTITVLIARRRHYDMTDLVMAIGTAYLALTVARNVAFFGSVAAPIATYHFSALAQARGWMQFKPARPTAFQIRLNWLIIGLVTLFVGAYLAMLIGLDKYEVSLQSRQPVQAIEAMLAQQPPREIYNDYGWGGYLIFHAPEYPVFIDGRTDLYGSEFTGRYFNVTWHGEPWQPFFEEHGVQTALIRADSPLAQSLLDAGWRELHRDPMAVLLTAPQD